MKNGKYELLVGKIICQYGSRVNFARAMGMSDLSLKRKLAGECDFKSSDIIKACELLMIEPADIGLYFFAK